jgi:hypothetical protein
MWPCPPGVPGWTGRYAALADTEIDDRWNLGEITTEELMTLFATDIGSDPEILIAHCVERCRDVRFFDHAWAMAQAHSLPQAIVTVNPDLFTRFVVPNYPLESAFDVIVTSWESRTLDKAELCAIALTRLGGNDPAEGLLIDNVEANVEAWRARGGQGYLHLDDARFARDFPLLVAENA